MHSMQFSIAVLLFLVSRCDMTNYTHGMPISISLCVLVGTVGIFKGSGLSSFSTVLKTLPFSGNRDKPVPAWPMCFS